jgi:hypothetical protein
MLRRFYLLMFEINFKRIKINFAKEIKNQIERSSNLHLKPKNILTLMNTVNGREKHISRDVIYSILNFKTKFISYLFFFIISTYTRCDIV